MEFFQENNDHSPADWDTDQAIRALKKGSYLLKYGRKGKPKICPFHLSHDETLLIWYVGKEEKQLKLSHVSKIIPGQRTAIFQRYPQPEKEYQSFSLLYGSRSLDLICTDKDEAEVWFVALRALISRGSYPGWDSDAGKPSIDQTIVPSKNQTSNELKGTRLIPVPSKKSSKNKWTKAFSDVISLTATKKTYTWTSLDPRSISILSTKSSDCSRRWNSTVSDNPDGRNSLVLGDPCAHGSIASSIPVGHDSEVSDILSGCSGIVSNNSGNCSSLASDFPNGSSSILSDYSNERLSSVSDCPSSVVDTSRLSLSSAVSLSSHCSQLVDLDASVDIFIWGERTGDGILGGTEQRSESQSPGSMDALLPKAIESPHVLDTQNVACGRDHAVLVTKQGQIFSWGDGSGGRLGHGVEANVSRPKLISAFSGFNIELIACGEYHTCAVTLSGDLYTWGDGIHNLGLLGHGCEVGHWIPKKVCGQIEGLRVSSIACGPWHTAAVTSAGELFTFGDGSFGALGHGDCSSSNIPREVETLKGRRALKASCGLWHTAAIVEVASGTCNSLVSGKLFTWGDGNKGQLGHGDQGPRLVPSCVTVPEDISFCQVACGDSMTIALTASGQVYSMGSTDYGQLGSPESSGKLPTCIRSNIRNSHIEEIACGSCHVAVLSSKSEVYTWGKGANGQLGHGDNGHRSVPTIVKALKNKKIKTLVCGSNFTAAICLQKWVSSVDHSICSGCCNQFNFRRKCHHCYNCGLAFCHACSGRKSLRAAMAPNTKKPYRVCDDCFTKLMKDGKAGMLYQLPRCATGITHSFRNGSVHKETPPRPKRRLSRILSFGSVRETENQHSRWSFESCYSGSDSDYGCSSKISTSIPRSSLGSQASSPLSRKSCPTGSVARILSQGNMASPEVILEGSKQTSENFIQETSILRAQVEDLLCKSQLLEAELKRTCRQLKEATDLAKEEAQRNKAADEVIRSLTTKLNSMAETIPSSSQGNLTTTSDIEHEPRSKTLHPDFSDGC